MESFRLPYGVDIIGNRCILKGLERKYQYPFNRVNVSLYLTLDECRLANEIWTLSDQHALGGWQGTGMAEGSTPFRAIGEKIADRGEGFEPIKAGDNVFITEFPPPSWNFNDLTSEYHPEEGEQYLEARLMEGAHEMDVLELASGLSYLYGWQFDVHTASTERGIYLVTIRDYDEGDALCGVASHADEVARGFNISIKAKRRAAGSERLGEPTARQDFMW